MKPAQLTPQTDPEVRVPTAVKAAAARADAIHKHAYETDADRAYKAADKAAADKIAEDKAAADKAAADKLAADKKTTPPVTPEGNPDWEHQYKSLKGRYDQLIGAQSASNERMAKLENLVASLQTKPPEAPVAPAEPSRLITADEEKEYGTEFLGVVGKRAKEELNPVMTALKQAQDEIASLKAQVGSVGSHVAATARDRLFASLDRSLSNWREVNNDPNFIAWLALPDPYSGAIRHNLLKTAFGENDAHRVFAFFNGFLTEEAALDPATRGPGPKVTEAAVPPAEPRVTLESLAAPGRAKSAPGETPAEKPIITPAYIAAFYTSVAAGKFRGKDEEKARLEAQIFAAQSENRIR